MRAKNVKLRTSHKPQRKMAHRSAVKSAKPSVDGVAPAPNRTRAYTPFQTLLESNRHLADIIESVSDGLLLWDRDYRYVYLNHYAEQFIGRSRAELLGKKAWDIFPASVSVWKPQLDQAFESGQPVHFEQYGALTNEWYEVHAYPSADGLLVHFHDCSERKHSADSLFRPKHELAVLNAIIKALNQNPTLHVGLRAALEQIAVLAGVDGVECRLFSSSGVLQLSEQYGLDPEFVAASPKLLALDSLPSRAMRLRVPIYITDLESEPLFFRKALARQKGYRSALFVPMIGFAGATGLFTLFSLSPREFSDEQEKLLLLIGEQLSMAIERSQLSGMEEQHTRGLIHTNALMLGLSRAASHIETSQGVEQAMESVGQELRRLRLNCLIMIFEPANESLVCRYSSVPERKRQLFEKVTGLQLDNFRLSAAQTPLLFKLLHRPMPLLMTDVAQRAHIYLPQVQPEAVKRVLSIAGLMSRTPLAVLPMIFKGQTVGVFLVWGPGLGRADLPALSIFASELGAAFENARLFTQVQVARERLQRLSYELLSAQEEERRRLSRELHDEAGQALTVLKLNLKMLSHSLASENGNHQQLDEAIELADATTEMIRLLAYNLRPPSLDQIGLHTTLENYCREFARRTQLRIDYQGVDLPNLPAPLSITIYRLVQEALTNVTKHAQADQVHIKLSHQAGNIDVTIEDNGIGMQSEARSSVESAKAGIGLLGVQERVEVAGGELKIESHARRGARLVARLPWRES